MKGIISFLFIFLAAVLTHAQTQPGSKSTTPASSPSDVKSTIKPDSIESLLAELKTAEARVEVCGLDESGEICKESPGAKVSEIYQKIVRNPAAVEALLGSTLQGYQNLRTGARGAVQVSQAADEAGIKLQLMLISQNQRIIDLLEQLVKKRP